ncbi:MAG TPA: hypothetical protein VKY92_20075 [Verrucomicrobiae bacterium]|nr:hypothetical protein [Verrucomicrobiae bacterium]
MKYLVVLFAITTVALGILCTVQSRQSTAQQAQLAALQNTIEEKGSQIENLQAAQQKHEQQRQELLGQVYQLTAQARVGQASPTNGLPAASDAGASQPAAPGDQQAGIGSFFSKLMQDPDTRQLVRNTQRMMMDQLYSPLIKNLGLSADEAARFKDLLADNTMKSADRASSVLGGPGSTNRSEAFASMAEDQKSLESDLKSLLGDSRYSQYKEYQDSIAERMQLNAFKQQAGSDYGLTDSQTEALLKIMKDEQQKAAANLPPGAVANPGDPGMFSMSDDKINALIENQQATAQQVYDRARSVLSPDQLGAFGQFQTNQLQMMRMGMGMARKMFGPAAGN